MMTSRILKILFFGLIIKPIVFIVLGLNIRNRNKLPLKGPAIITPNHNSHLDTMVLMSLYPLSVIHKVRPVAAADYFLTNKLLAWFSLNVIGIIPLERKYVRNLDKLFHGCVEALQSDNILIFFPEGSRGAPEKMAAPKKGIFHLLKKQAQLPVIPVVMHGLGRALPRGEALFVPFNCDVIIGDELPQAESADELVESLSSAYTNLFQFCITRNTLDK